MKTFATSPPTLGRWRTSTAPRRSCARRCPRVPTRGVSSTPLPPSPPITLANPSGAASFTTPPASRTPPPNGVRIWRASGGGKSARRLATCSRRPRRGLCAHPRSRSPRSSTSARSSLARTCSRSSRRATLVSSARSAAPARTARTRRTQFISATSATTRGKPRAWPPTPSKTQPWSRATGAGTAQTSTRRWSPTRPRSSIRGPPSKRSWGSGSSETETESLAFQSQRHGVDIDFVFPFVFFCFSVIRRVDECAYE
mmetsp:Transcript_7678/g.25434  ORF Transcript_7678/g.25434 Transcript_7678/m.25434 type:complete len:256 (+) Transcript_7678:799-1566(+)